MDDNFGIEGIDRLSTEDRDKIARMAFTNAGYEKRITTLEKANADLNSRLDELRRLHARPIPLGGQHIGTVRLGKDQPERSIYSTPVEGDTASGRLAERLSGEKVHGDGTT